MKRRKSSKYLEFYKECMKTGRMPKDGLCHNFNNDRLLKLFHADRCGYWAFTGWNNFFTLDDIQYKFNPLRQTIVLLMHELYLQEQ